VGWFDLLQGWWGCRNPNTIQAEPDPSIWLTHIALWIISLYWKYSPCFYRFQPTYQQLHKRGQRRL